MKHILIILSIFLFSLTVISCGEKEESTTTDNTTTTKITYPSSGNYGDNLLMDETITLSTSSNYSLRVEKEVGSIVKIIFPIPDNSSNMWWWSGSTTHNWYEGSGSEGNLGSNRIFITESRTLYADMKISFTGSQSVNIEIYENGVTTATRTKTLSW